MKEIETEGKTVNEAVESALERLGLRREQVEVQIIQEGSSGILGFGIKPARVKIVEKLWGSPASRGQSARGRGAAPAPRRSGDYPPAEAAPSTHQAPAAARPQKKSEPRRRAERPAASQPDPRRTVPAEAACSACQEILESLLSLMFFEDARFSARWDEEQERVKAAVETSEHKRLIGPEGRTLEALQFLITLMVGRRLGSPVAVQVDTQGYWEAREQAVLSEARKGVEVVRGTGKPFRMAPMDPQMRRLIHRSLAGDPDIVTSSEGDGAWRKIVLRPSNHK